MTEPTIWKEDWPEARRKLKDWWEGKGFALHAVSPKDEPHEAIPPPPPADLKTRWLDPDYRAHADLYELSRTFFGGVAFPIGNANVGPGSLGLMLGCEAELAESTVWYAPIIENPENHPPLRFDREGEWWKAHVEIMKASLRVSEGRYWVGCPDLIENLDTLAQLRGSERVLMDLLERPDWAKEKIAEINRAFFECYDAMLDYLADPWGGTAYQAFALWGPGKTAKLQCDFSCMISPAMFREFVSPALTEQAEWLDFALYHLDGTQALPQLPNLLAIDALRAIEWTPQAGLPGGGSPEWYGLYREIKAAGKGVQAVGVAPSEVEPLIDAVGPEGLFILCYAGTETEARDLLRRVGG